MENNQSAFAAENKGMKSCKSCGAPISKKAKTCPNCGAKNKKPIYLRPWLWVVAILLIIGIAASFGDESESKNIGEDTVADSENVENNNGKNEKERTENKNTTAKPAAQEIKYEIGKSDISFYQSSINTTWMRIAVPVKNTGKINIYLPSADMDLETESGSLVDTVSLVSAYPTIIKPGETGWYFETRTYDGDTGVKVVPNIKPVKAKADCVRLAVSDVSIKDEDFLGAAALGRITNSTDITLTGAHVTVNLFDGSGKMIGRLTEYVTDELAPGASKSFKATSLSSVKASEIAEYEIYAFQDTFNW